MTPSDIVQLRLSNQQITGQSFRTPQEVLSWFGAIQAQDFMGGKWAIGLRVPKISETDIVKALEEKSIVRTWPMRGTLHFVTPADIRWLLSLLAVRILPRLTPRFKQLEIDDETLRKGKRILVSLLSGHKSATRDDIYNAFEQGGISAKEQRGLHIIGYAAMEGLICFGALKQKQQTFVLLEEWVPKEKTYSREESLGMLATRYFIAHGPATLQDFVWWTGLSVGDAKRAIELSEHTLHKEIIEGNTYYMQQKNIEKKIPNIVKLLPPFDEYLVGYKDRTAALESTGNPKSLSAIQYLLSPTVLVNGHIVGTWKRQMKQHQVMMTYDLFRTLTADESQLLQQASEQYATFFGKTLICK
jgi:hypothetical protein